MKRDATEYQFLMMLRKVVLKLHGYRQQLPDL